MKRYVRISIGAVGLLVALAAACGGLAWWFERGPGFRRQCDRLAAVAGIRSGMTVADLGAGSGRVAVSIATSLGPSGRLYATELDEARLREIEHRATLAGLTNITPVQAGVNSTGLPADCCDVIYLRRVYHHLSDAKAIVAGIYSSLRPDGRLVVVDMLTPRWLPHSLQHGIPSEDIRHEVESVGFRLERQFDSWSPIDYCLIFRKGDRRD